MGAREEVAQLAETVGGPVVKALLGKAVLPDRSPYTTGGLGLLGTAPSVDAMEECDTLILIGTSYPYMEFLPKPGQAKCVQIELDPTRIGLRHQVDAALVGDAKTILQALLPLLKRKNNKFLKKAQERMKTWNELMEERGTRKDMPMKPQVVTHTLNRLLEDDAIVSVGQRHHRYLDRALHRNARHDAILSLRLARHHGQWPALQHWRRSGISQAARWSAWLAMAA